MSSIDLIILKHCMYTYITHPAYKVENTLGHGMKLELIVPFEEVSSTISSAKAS